MSTNRILALGAVALMLYLGFFYGLRAAFPRAEVGYDTALTGRITGTFMSKRQRTFFLNGQKSPRYDFDAFALMTTTAGQLHAGYEQREGKQLSQYLRVGDVVRKPAHGIALTVQRGDSLTQWVCAPSQTTH
ncbi:hypothetical protein [Hymenobacter negativus]|uniref:Uncharacterized protein n=1 Tax=Hymenobacter negativus TaxID=2795026 RepID=A0ABS3QMG5_9BACT|nr:hypothetical protein [Hymenobacter negativus]MBO2012322.1 hypothetical protein [Hymenobacter negativus]